MGENPKKLEKKYHRSLPCKAYITGLRRGEAMFSSSSHVATDPEPRKIEINCPDNLDYCRKNQYYPNNTAYRARS
jgi:hypothetical protein